MRPSDESETSCEEDYSRSLNLTELEAVGLFTGVLFYDSGADDFTLARAIEESVSCGGLFFLL